MNKGRKITGGKYHKLRKTKVYERKKQENVVALGKTKNKKIRIRGGNKKTILLNSNQANVYNPQNKKIQKAEIKNVLETPQNKFLARQNRLTKGTIIETFLGKAKITNRPSQEGHVNAILIE